MYFKVVINVIGKYSLVFRVQNYLFLKLLPNGEYAKKLNDMPVKVKEMKNNRALFTFATCS